MSPSISRNFVVVPESLSVDEAGRPTGKPSFAYCQVLDYVIRTAAADDRVVLAPANSFGGSITEERAAYEYLAERRPLFELLCPGINLPSLPRQERYVDTWGNARLLRSVFDIRGKSFELITTHLHAARAQWCFSKAGFSLSRVHSVQYTIDTGYVTRRNFYYKYPLLHRAYEGLALIRDKCKYGWLP
jgi:uncharacterized SAM-binding protein YcdF (DUF218 family)